MTRLGYEVVITRYRSPPSSPSHDGCSDTGQPAYQEWEVCSEMMARTDPTQDRDMPLNIFSGRIEGSGRVTLSTFHSAKGREFEAVVMFGINNGDIPNWRDNRSVRALREARRLFYVGVTRPRKELCLVYQEHHHSPWVAELYQRSQED